MWRGTRKDATGHTRPRGRATRTHAGVCVVRRWRRGMAGPRESTLTPGWCLRGNVRGWQVMGPRVSGPTLASLGGNANVLFCPTFYTYHFPPFSPCGTMFPLNFSFGGNVTALQTLDAIALIKAHRSCGPESMRSPSKHVR